MEITHHGHSCIELTSGQTRLLLDPGSFSSFDDVKDVNAIIVTHQHADHLDPEKIELLRANNPEAQWFADPQTAAQLQEKGVTATPTEADGHYSVGAFDIEGVGSQHAEIHPYIDRINNVGVVVSDGDIRLFHPGDALEGRPENIDYLAVPVNAPWAAVKDTIAFVRAVEPTRIIPIHDHLLKPAARTMYLRHIGDYGREGGVEIFDVAHGETRKLN